MKYRVIHVTGGVRNTISGVQSFIKNHIKTDDEEFEYIVGESNGDSHFLTWYVTQENAKSFIKIIGLIFFMYIALLLPLFIIIMLK